MEVLKNSIIKYGSGRIFGLATVFIGTLSNFIAFILFPGYRLTHNNVSDLGIGPGALFFNLGLVITSLLCVPFLLCINNVLKKEVDVVGQKLRKNTIRIAYFCCFSVAMVGVFPSDYSRPIILGLHMVAAVCSFGSGIILFALLGALLYQSEHFSKFQAINAWIVSGIILFFSLNLYPLTEWIAFISILSFVIDMSIYMAIKRM